MNTYIVTIPIAGHITFEIEAETPAEAESKAWELPTEEGEVSWEMLENFGRGNVCSCPSPWEVSVEEA